MLPLPCGVKPPARRAHRSYGGVIRGCAHAGRTLAVVLVPREVDRRNVARQRDSIIRKYRSGLHSMPAPCSVSSSLPTPSS